MLLIVLQLMVIMRNTNRILLCIIIVTVFVLQVLVVIKEKSEYSKLNRVYLY